MQLYKGESYKRLADRSYLHVELSIAVYIDLLFVERRGYRSMFNLRMMFEHPFSETVGVAFRERSLVKHNTFVIFSGFQLEIWFCFFKSCDFRPLHFIIDLSVDIQGDVFLADNYFACPVFAAKLRLSGNTKCLVCVHPVEKDSSIYCDKRQEGPDRSPSHGCVYSVKIYPAKYSCGEDKAIYIKNR